MEILILSGNDPSSDFHSSHSLIDDTIMTTSLSLLQVRICREVGRPFKKVAVSPGHWWAHQNGIKRRKKAWNVLTLLTRPPVTNFSVSLWSSVQPASTRRGRWSEQPSERCETSSSKASAAVWWCRGCLSLWTMHLLTFSIHMWQQLFVKCSIFFSLFSGMLNAYCEQEALSIRVAIITRLFTEILRVVHAS